LEVKAKEFNAYYKKISGKIINSPEEDISIEEQWNSLSNIKKDSSRNQCMHQNVKEVLLEKIAQIQVPAVNLGPWGKELHKRGERVFIEDFLDTIPTYLLKLLYRFNELL